MFNEYMNEQMTEWIHRKDRNCREIINGNTEE